MADVCLCRLIVAGPDGEVSRFTRAAESLDERAQLLPLSFERLRPLRPHEDPVQVYGTPWTKPEYCSRHVTRGGRKTKVEYRFLTKWSEPVSLVRSVARQYPRLEFLLGAVAPAVGEANCWYFSGRRGANWRMPGEARTRLYRKVYRAAGVDRDEPDLDEQAEWSLNLEFDHALMDAVVRYWTTARRKEAMRARSRARAKER